MKDRARGEDEPCIYTKPGEKRRIKEGRGERERKRLKSLTWMMDRPRVAPPRIIDKSRSTWSPSSTKEEKRERERTILVRIMKNYRHPHVRHAPHYRSTLYTRSRLQKHFLSSLLSLLLLLYSQSFHPFFSFPNPCRRCWVHVLFCVWMRVRNPHSGYSPPLARHLFSIYFMSTHYTLWGCI